MSSNEFNDRFGITDLSPTEFEKTVMAFFESFPTQPVSVNTEHDVNLSGEDGIYQIDIKLTYELFGVSFLILVECKRYSTPIKRESVQILNSKLVSLGAQKGILVSSSGYQRGAIEYAKKHGIALLRVAAGGMTYETKNRLGTSMPYLPEGLEAYPIYRIAGTDRGSITITMLIDDHLKEFGVSLFKG